VTEDGWHVPTTDQTVYEWIELLTGGLRIKAKKLGACELEIEILIFL